jgi:hypothetical protein
MPDECHDSVLNNDNKLLEDLYDTDFRSTFLLSLWCIAKSLRKKLFFTGTYYMYVYLLKMTFWYLLL